MGSLQLLLFDYETAVVSILGTQDWRASDTLQYKQSLKLQVKNL